MVTLNPRHAGAWIDLALATYRCGDADAALEHLAYIRHSFPLEPLLARRLDLWQQQWQAPAPLPMTARWHGEIEYGIGHDDNANAGLLARRITLSLPGGTTSLPLHPDYRPRADQFALLNFSAWGPERPFAGGNLMPVVQVRSRVFAHEHEYRQADIQAGLIHRLAPNRAGRYWQLGAFAQHYRLGGHSLSNTWRLALQKIHESDGCRLGAGGEIENRTYSGLPLGGTVLWLTSGLGCSAQTGRHHALVLRLGRDIPHESSRPGGASTLLEATAHVRYPLPGDRHFSAIWQLSRQTDADPYSPILDNNATRRLSRSLINLALYQPLGPQQGLKLAFDVQRQHANLALFSQRSRQIAITFMHRF